MASLWALYQKGKRDIHPALAEMYQTVDFLIAKLPPLLVTAQSTIDALESLNGSPIDFSRVSRDATPCHRSLWLEWMSNGSREARLVSRLDVSEITSAMLAASSMKAVPPDARFLLRITPFSEHQGAIQQHPSILIFIDKLGEFLFDSFIVEIVEPTEESKALVYSCLYTVAEILTVMNTRGTRIEPPLDKPPAQVVKPKRPPHSVWHTIHLPKFLQEPMNAETSGEVVERREHWVRAHRRDYRKGGGLFGRIHGLIWVPEFQRGNPELGTVKQSFAVHPLPERVQP